MTQCFNGTWNTGCCQSHRPNLVSFDNLKKKYSANDDIRIEYTLHGDFQEASTRDWLGIFPRGWSNLQQYLTFEYALVAPRAAASSNRTIIFPRVFHQEASTTTEYQLVYVSREIQVLASSLYFRFIRDDETDLPRQFLRIPCRLRNSSSEKQEIGVDRLASSDWTPPRIVLSDQSLMSFRQLGTIPADPRLSRNCRSCGKPRETVSRVSAGRARFLATHNVSLAERVIRLERDLALAEGAKTGLTERLRAYESFVSDMIRSLATKRVVKITDASGKEIVLQQLPIVCAKSDAKTTEISKNLAGRKGRNDDPEKQDLSTNDRESVGEYLSVDKILSSKDEAAHNEEVLDNSKEDSSVDEIRTSCTDVETQTKCTGTTTGVENCEGNIEVASKCNEECDKNQGAKEEEGETVETDVASDRKELSEKVEDEREKAPLQSKPSAIVIQGSNVKFAIIRY